MQGLEYYNILKFWCISNEKHIKETSMEHIDEVICERIIGCNIDTVSVNSQTVLRLQIHKTYFLMIPVYSMPHGVNKGHFFYLLDV